MSLHTTKEDLLWSDVIPIQYRIVTFWSSHRRGNASSRKCHASKLWWGGMSSCFLLFGLVLVGASSFQSPRSPVLCFFYFAPFSFVSFLITSPPPHVRSFFLSDYGRHCWWHTCNVHHDNKLHASVTVYMNWHLMPVRWSSTSNGTFMDSWKSADVSWFKLYCLFQLPFSFSQFSFHPFGCFLFMLLPQSCSYES